VPRLYNEDQDQSESLEKSRERLQADSQIGELVTEAGDSSSGRGTSAVESRYQATTSEDRG
jgi:hypothetical protein